MVKDHRSVFDSRLRPWAVDHLKWLADVRFSVPFPGQVFDESDGSFRWIVTRSKTNHFWDAFLLTSRASLLWISGFSSEFVSGPFQGHCTLGPWFEHIDLVLGSRLLWRRAPP